ncbi:acyl carrier protein [uncultured Clostridium sp.]|uniref:acyl carrier protein n=1 Tax=uncultured Clostridium sp. TaxID=59620 RepID=UPI00265FDBBB|nr:acyl carrier protein [uncultured Clostridium sp.]
MKHKLTQEEILVEIKDILSEYIEITRPLTPADRLIDDLGLDSFLIVYFITEIEDCFEIDIPETDFIEFVTVKDLCERIQLEIKKHSPY